LLSKLKIIKMKKLMEMGIKSTRLTTDGKGETQPVANNTTTEGKAQNRRVEFVKQ
jgi:OmpA-OmpF porin, OOP family